MKRAIQIFREALSSGVALIFFSVGLLAVWAYLEKRGFAPPYPMLIDWRVALAGSAWLLLALAVEGVERFEEPG